MELVEAYRLYGKMMRYPHLIENMRNLFVNALAERSIPTGKTWKTGPGRYCFRKALKQTRKPFWNIACALVDLTFAAQFHPQEQEDYDQPGPEKGPVPRVVPLWSTWKGARPQKFKKPSGNSPTSPRGTCSSTRREAEGVRVALINHFVSNHLPFIGIAKNHLTIRDNERTGGTLILGPPPAPEKSAANPQAMAPGQ